MADTIKYFLEESKMPKTWYNIAADLPKPMEPPLHPGTLKPIGPDDLAPLFPMALIGQEVSQDREIEINGLVYDYCIKKDKLFDPCNTTKKESKLKKLEFDYD